MAFNDTMKEYFNKGVDATKIAFDKCEKSFKKAFNKTSNAVQDFGDKSVVRIEKHQLESKRDEKISELGKKVLDKFIIDNITNINIDDIDISQIISEIKNYNAEIEKRENILSQKAE